MPEMTTFKTDIGRCIYCDSTIRSLTREHVMPRGLGGNDPPEGAHSALVLQRASCEDCRQLTARIEDTCLNGMFPHVRSRLGLRRKDRQLETVAVKAVLPDGSAEEREVLVDYVPGPMVIPRFKDAEILTGKPSEGPDIISIFPRQLRAPPDAMSGLAKMGVSLTAHPKQFAQMLAKIGLGLAVAAHGVDGFEPLVREFIREQPNEYTRWVGGVDPKGDEPLTSLHQVRLSSQPGASGTFILAYIKLFAEFGGPANYVVVGRT